MKMAFHVNVHPRFPGRPEGDRQDTLDLDCVIVGTVEITKCIERGPKDVAYALKNPVRFKRALKPKKNPKPQPCFWQPTF